MKKFSEAWQPYQLRFSLIGLEESCPKPSLFDLYGVPVQNTLETGPDKDKRERAVLGAGMVTVSSKAKRIDFLWESLPPLDGLLRLGKLSEAVPHLFDPIRSYISSYSWGRVAFGATCGAEVRDRETGYGQLNERIEDVEIDEKNSLDFLYQINKPIEFDTVAGQARLGRLQRWSVSRVKFKITSEGDGDESDADLPQLPELLLAQVSLDFSTPTTLDRKVGGEEAISILERAVVEAENLIGE